MAIWVSVQKVHQSWTQNRVFHNSRLIRWIQKKFRDLTRNWTQVSCLTARHFNLYTRMFSVLAWGYNWILFMHWWFCPIHLIHLIGLKSLHFEKKLGWKNRSISIWPICLDLEDTIYKIIHAVYKQTITTQCYILWQTAQFFLLVCQ